jgi:ribonuclease P protein component
VVSRNQASVPDPASTAVHGEGLGPECRMHERRAFVRCYRRGFRVHGPLVTLHVHAHHLANPPRLGITASRKVGKAVVRQRCKRRVREIFRRWQDRSSLGPLDIVVHVKPSARDASFSFLESSLERQLRKVVARTA